MRPSNESILEIGVSAILLAYDRIHCGETRPPTAGKKPEIPAPAPRGTEKCKTF
jgi:hypothetical protein